MTKDERKARRKADKALLKAVMIQAAALYAMDSSDRGKWDALGFLAAQLVTLAEARAAEA